MQATMEYLRPLEVVCKGWIHAFGTYYPRRNALEHQRSDWSKAVILAKRKSENVISHFGAVIASHLEHLLMDDEPYVITHVPTDPDTETYLFDSMQRCATEILATYIHANLTVSRSVEQATLLIQVRQKPRKQHQCANTAQRIANVRGLYAVADEERTRDRNIILVDDVITSGATMNECARVLKSAGALDVIGVALARTVKLSEEQNHVQMR